MGGCINRGNNIIIIKHSEKIKQKNIYQRKKNKNRLSLISFNLEVPQNHIYELSIHTISSNEFENEIGITDNKSSYSNVNNNTVKEIMDIIQI